jgi:hypothetical protein
MFTLALLMIKRCKKTPNFQWRTSAQVPSDRALLPVLSSLVRLRRWRQALRLLPQRGAVGAAALSMTSSAVAATAQPVGEIRKDGQHKQTWRMGRVIGNSP